MAKRTTRATSGKPPKPHKDFPLFPHASGQWAKKVRGRLVYFGKWADPQAALERWIEQKDDLLAGRTPRQKTDGLMVRGLVNRFLTDKQHLADTGEIVVRTFRDYHNTCKGVVEVFGPNRPVTDLVAEDFQRLRAELAKTRNAVSLGNEVGRVRVLFKWGYDNGLIDHPIRYGQSFKRPSRKVLRKARQARGLRMFQPEEIRAILGAAGVQLKAMILLGINCGFGPADCGTLPKCALDLDRGWIDYPRPKTGVERKCPLWSETVTALRETFANCPAPKNPGHGKLVFVTKYGKPWAKDASSASPISAEFRKLTKATKIKQDGRKRMIYRQALTFYSLRHTFQTVGDGSRDAVAVRSIMGHAESGNDMSAVYRERISDERLQAVTDHIHEWLFSTDLDAENPAETARSPNSTSATKK